MTDMPKKTEPKKDALSRRHLLGIAALGCVGAASTIEVTWPRRKREREMEGDDGKASKKVAGYYEKPTDSAQNCSSCHFYITPDTCAIVEGLVAPWGYCNYYAD